MIIADNLLTVVGDLALVYGEFAWIDAAPNKGHSTMHGFIIASALAIALRIDELM